jgi:hypothetical protein
VWEAFIACAEDQIIPDGAAIPCSGSCFSEDNVVAAFVYKLNGPRIP